MSYNSLMTDAALTRWYRLQDDAATANVVDSSGNGGVATFTGASTTSERSVTGPTTYLPKSLRMGPLSGDSTATAVYVNVSATGIADFSEYTIACWGSLQDTTLSRLQGLWVCGDVTPAIQPWRETEENGTFYPGDSTSTPSPLTWSLQADPSIWAHYAASHSTTFRQVVRDGVSVASDSSSYSFTNSVSSFFIGRNRGNSGSSNNWRGPMADFALWSRQLTLAEIQEHRLGPEPVVITAPTLQIVDGAWEGSVGTWDSQSNGSLTYVWQLRLSSDDSVIESGTGNSPSGSGLASGEYYLYVLPSNNGGSDLSAVSEDVTFSRGSRLRLATRKRIQLQTRL